MAPDAASMAAGRKLAQATQWKLLGASDTHLWGELQGSGAKPYQTCIERAEPAFHCSCPSRKFPCKHGIALACIEVDTPAALPASAPPEWVEAWIAKRAGNQARKQTRSEAAAKPVDAETAARRAKEQEKRANARLDKARGGVEFVSQWLSDGLRQGLAAHADQPYRYWDELAARTVDAQIGGLARHFRQLPALRHARAQWQTPYLDTYARLHLLCSAFGQYEQLEPGWRGDLDAALGFSQNKDELLASMGIKDRWCVLGMTEGEDEGLRYQRTWLHGERSGQTAMLLDFAARGQVLPACAPPGCGFEGEIIFYPSAWPQRALLKDRAPPETLNALPGGVESLDAARECYASAAEKLPWIERIALTLRAVTPLLRDSMWLVADCNGDALPLSPDCDNAWELLALSAGQSVDLFCEFDGETLLPLTVANSHGARALPQGSARIAAAPEAAQYPPWRQAVTTTLLGAERQQHALSASGPAGGVLERLYPQGALPADSEARSRALLDAVSVLSLYRKAAQAPQRITPLPEPCPPDELPAASDAAAYHLRQILDAKDAALLREWLASAAACGKRCPEVLLPKLLDTATQSRKAGPHLAAVLGRRGAWLAGQHKPWHALCSGTQDDPLRDWEEGSPEKRRQALQRLRTTEPDAARERLAAVMGSEAAGVRAALLAALREGLSERDEAFLESCLADKSQEVRQNAAELLSLLPDAAFKRRVQARAQAWLQFKPKTGLLSHLGGKKGELEATLPEAWDAAWARDGLIEKAPRGKGVKAWWLEQTLALIPPRFWTQQWKLSAAECLALLEKHEWRDALLGGWVQATLTQRDAEWAEALLSDADGNIAAAARTVADAGLHASLWQVFSPDVRERVLIERIRTRRSDALLDLLTILSALDEAWSRELSLTVLDAWQRLVDESGASRNYRLGALLREGATYFAPQEFPRFEQAFARELASEGPWHGIINETRERLRFRQAMHAALRN